MTRAHHDNFTLQELCEVSGVTPRTVRYYIKQGLLQGASRSGPGVQYPEGHLWRLRLIRRLQEEHLPLAKIRARLETISDAEIKTLLESTLPPDVDRQGPEDTSSASEYIKNLLVRSGPAPPLKKARMRGQPNMTERSQWDRIVIDPDIEIHVRRPQSRQKNKRIAQLIELAHQCIKEPS